MHFFSQDPWSCNADCSCNNEAFNPICGSDGVEFRSPCHAGCLAMMMDNMSMKVTVGLFALECLSAEHKGWLHHIPCVGKCPLD